MDVDARLWNFIVRIVYCGRDRGKPVRCVLEFITTDEMDAAAFLAAWRQDEPDDDCVCVGWSAARGHYFKGSNIATPGLALRPGFLDEVTECLARPVMQAVNLAIRAMQGEYGAADEYTIRPNCVPWEDMPDE